MLLSPSSPPLPLIHSRMRWQRHQTLPLTPRTLSLYRIIWLRHHPSSPPHLPHKNRNNSPKLNIRKLLPNTPMSPRPERQIRRIPPLTNESVSEIDFLVRVLLRTRWPAFGDEGSGVVPVEGVDCADSGGTHEEVTGWEDVVCPWDGEGGDDFAD
jgi:hypothetical protein